MRSIRLGATVIALLVAGSAYADVLWTEATFDAAMASARDANKPVLLDFYATWCGPCKRMDKEVYSDAAVTKISGGFVNLRLDAEKGEGIDLAKRFRIFNYPTIVLLHADGSEIDRVVGYRPAAEFAQILTEYPSGVNTTEDWLRRADASPDDLATNLEAGERANQRSLRADAERTLGRVLAADPKNEKGYASRAMLILADLARKEEDFKKAIATTESMLEKFPDAAEADEAYSDLGYYYKKSGDNDNAAETYRKVSDRHPDDVGLLNQYAWFCAKSGVDLEDATTAALKAVELSKGDSGILDTLAEVYFARGMHAKAIDAGEKALAKSPDDSYLAGQLDKFREAARAKAEAR